LYRFLVSFCSARYQTYPKSFVPGFLRDATGDALTSIEVEIRRRILHGREEVYANEKHENCHCRRGVKKRRDYFAGSAGRPAARVSRARSRRGGPEASGRSIVAAHACMHARRAPTSLAAPQRRERGIKRQTIQMRPSKRSAQQRARPGVPASASGTRRKDGQRRRLRDAATVAQTGAEQYAIARCLPRALDERARDQTRISFASHRSRAVHGWGRKFVSLHLHLSLTPSHPPSGGRTSPMGGWSLPSSALFSPCFTISLGPCLLLT
jgi:hypothetical protein